MPTSVAVEAPTGLALLCTGQGYTGRTDKTVYVSSDLGASWKLAGHPGQRRRRRRDRRVRSGAPDHRHHQRRELAVLLRGQRQDLAEHGTYPDGGQGCNDLGFTTTRDGVVIHGHPYYGDMVGRLLLTGNGGLTWHAVTF